MLLGPNASDVSTSANWHRCGAHAMGDMAAQILIKRHPQAGKVALEEVFFDKEREASGGYYGTQIAHPRLVQIAMDVFDAKMPTPNQL